MEAEPNIPTGITLSPAAARRIAEIAARQGKDPARLRLSVDGGGCAGFRYHFELADTLADDDVEVLTPDGVGLVIDTMSLPLVDGCIVDFVTSVAGSAFEVKNPNAASSCSCGTSFGI